MRDLRRGDNVKAGETTIKDLLEGDKLYVVPRYQRRYAWRRADWEQLWRAVERQYVQVSDLGFEGASHFLGSLVIAQRQSFPTDASNYDLIDGQQRLTTLMLLLAALRDHGHADSDHERAAREKERVESLMRNRFEEGDFSIKVMPGSDDREFFYALMEGHSEASGGLMLQAYRYFAMQISELREREDWNLNNLLNAATKHMEVVQILTSPSDNAHRIFQTLNSTGMELTGVDLLRNHFFMLLPSRMDEAYSEFWHPMEEELGDSFTKFLWVDLVSQPRMESVPNKPDRIYAEWQAILDPIAGSERDVIAELTRLAKSAKLYHAMVTASTGDEDVDSRLRRLRLWGVDVHHPFTFGILLRLTQNDTSSESVARALSFVESFLVRRMLAGVPTNNLNRIFTTSIGQLHHEFYASMETDVAVRRILSQQGKYWPSNEVLKRDGLLSPFYERQRSTQRQFVLKGLEEAICEPYSPNWAACTFTIEHVLPQTLTPAWMGELEAAGEKDPGQAHLELVHTLGNLTLTCENPDLGQMTFGGKKQIFQNDGIKMNDDIAEQSDWGRSEILERGERLLDLAMGIWASPAPEEEMDQLGLAIQLRVFLERIPEGRWLPLGLLSEAVDAPEANVRESLSMLAAFDSSDLVLESDGTFRPDQSESSRRSEVVERLMSHGVLETADTEAAAAEKALGLSDVEMLGDN